MKAKGQAYLCIALSLTLAACGGGGSNTDRTYKLSSEIFDDGADGVIDSRKDYYYDNKGNLLEYTFDTDADGISNYSISYSYDNHGNILTKKIDRDGNGLIDVTSSYTYDANGRKLSGVIDYASNDRPDLSISYRYDGDGNIYQEIYQEPNDHISIINFDYDENGNLLKEETDSDGDGQMNPAEDTTTYYTYDSAGHLTRKVVSEASGGGSSRTYDAQGSVLSEYADDYLRASNAHSYDYDTHNNIIKRTTTTTEFDRDHNQSPSNSVTTYKWVEI